jgi:hypothetical protein
MTTEGRRNMSDFDPGRNSLENLGIGVPDLADISARQRARSQEPNRQPAKPDSKSDLGPPLSIREVATMLGCSPWTVRQQHMPRGLPHFRSGPNGKLIFFRDQVVAWILLQQKKGGKP